MVAPDVQRERIASENTIRRDLRLRANCESQTTRGAVFFEDIAYGSIEKYYRSIIE